MMKTKINYTAVHLPLKSIRSTCPGIEMKKKVIEEGETTVCAWRLINEIHVILIPILTIIFLLKQYNLQ